MTLTILALFIFLTIGWKYAFWEVFKKFPFFYIVVFSNALNF